MSALAQRWPRRPTMRIALVVAAAILALLAFEAVGRIARDLRPGELKSAFAGIKAWQIGGAAALTMLSYACLACYDGFALKLIGRPLPLRQTAPVAFSSYAISNSLGFALLTGGSTRYVHYRRLGLSSADVARLALLCALAFWSALILLSGSALLLAPAHQKLPLPALDIGLRFLGVGSLVLVALGWALFLWVPEVRRRLLGKSQLNLPSLAGLQAVALLDVACAAGALFVLVGGGIGAVPQLALAYAVAIVLGVASHVPGGIGVFEATFLALAPARAGAGVAAILLYRLTYYVVPLLAALALEVTRFGPALVRPVRNRAIALARIGQAATPRVAALLAFAAGAIMLLSAATPAIPERIHFLARVAPLPLVEVSRFLASIVGTALLLLAPALNARLRSALLLTVGLLVTGALLCIAKGIDYEEAVALIVIAAILQASAPAFYRTAGIGSAPLSALSWVTILSIFAAVLVAWVLGHHRPVATETWWAIEFGTAPPRSVRGLVGAALLLAFIAFRQFLNAPRRSGPEPLPANDIVERALAAAERTDAFLAFTGDKQFLVSREGDAFLMYRVQGRTWVAMGDPVGPKDRWAELAWRLREAADQEAGRVCFYEVSERMLPTLVDLGLSTMKYGEEALLDLTPELVLPRKVRASVRRAESEGMTFQIIPSAELPLFLPELRRISDDWLRDKTGGEKCFSVGRFDPRYLNRFDCAIARQGNRICAFANLWALPNKTEASVDLMRRRRDAPHGTMDFLLANCITHAAREGYVRFSLGLAPLSGLLARPLAPLWARFGATVYRRGNRLYSFEGLRSYKQKFHPRWESRYVATMHGWSGALALIDTARLISA